MSEKCQPFPSPENSCVLLVHGPTVPLVIVMFDGNEIGQCPLHFYCREKLQREFGVYVRGNHDESWQCATG